MLLTNARIYTLDALGSIVDSLVVRDGRIAFTGYRRDINVPAGEQRLAGASAWRSLLAAGSLIAGGSDFPVEDGNPFHGICAAVTRRPLSDDGPPWQPAQRMTRAKAVRAFTTWNAYAARREHERGSLESGKRADLVVLSDDVFTCPEARIKDIVLELTMVDGEVVFRRERDTP